MLKFREFVENYDELDERTWTPAQRRRAKVMMKKIGVQMDVGLVKKCKMNGLFMDTNKDKIISINKDYILSKM